APRPSPPEALPGDEDRALAQLDRLVRHAAQHQATQVGQATRAHDDQAHALGLGVVEDGLSHLPRQRPADLGLCLDPGSLDLRTHAVDELFCVGSLLELPGATKAERHSATGLDGTGFAGVAAGCWAWR